jgi:hypothetical protein
MEAGPALDEVIGRLINSHYTRKWWAMNREETALYIDFDYQGEANEWLAKEVERRPEYVRENGIHIVYRRIYPRFSRSLDEATVLLTRFRLALAPLVALDGAIMDAPDFNWWCGRLGFDNEAVQEWNDEYIGTWAETAPLAVCRAVLLAAVGGVGDREARRDGR